MSDTYGLTKTLGVIDVYTKPNGEPWFMVGNNSVLFRIRHNGRDKILKCYTRNKRYLRRIYGNKCLREELYIHSDPNHGEWVDVIIDDWIEGKTLQRVIVENVDNPTVIKTLAEEFDKLAMKLLSKSWAHGDLKPENIIVTPAGEMRLIDFDAVFLPEFVGESSEETGTAAYQHPARTTQYFDKSIDDYSIALISTALHALSLDPSLAERYGIEESLIISPKETMRGTGEAYNEILTLFAIQGDVIHYRMALMLQSVTPRLFDLKKLLGYATAQKELPTASNEPLLLDYSNGLWGFRQGENFVIPPLYDSGFDFREGLAAVSVGKCWHYIDEQGDIVLRCPRYDAVKSFRNGEAVVIEQGVRKRINRKGEII